MGFSNNDLTLRVGFDTQKFALELGKTNKILTNWSSDMKTALKAVGWAALARQVTMFTLDISRLSGEAVGVSAAFNKLPESIKLMRDLKEATGGTVSELELMKRSVMASNFDISLRALPQLLEFATLRARQTGQSVNYLVDSIVTGIGRKSKLILDNLGISAVQLTEALGGASAASSTIGEVAEAVGRIAEKNLKTMGKLTDDAAVKADRLRASWDNFKVSLGTLANNAGVTRLIEMTTELTNMLNVASGGKSNNPLKDLDQAIKVINANFGKVGAGRLQQWLDAAAKLAKEAGVQMVRLEGDAGKVVFAYKKLGIWIDASNEETKETIRNIAFLEDQIKLLQEEIKLTTDKSKIKQWLEEVKSLQTEIDLLMGKVKTMKIDFSGLKGKDMPKVNGKWDDTAVPDFIGGMVAKFQQDAQAFKDMTKTIDEARKMFEDFGISTESGLAKASEAFSKFLKDGKLEDFGKAMSEIKEHEMEMRDMAADMGSSFGQELGNAITGAKTFAQAMGDMAKKVVASLKQIVLARMIADSAKYGVPGIIAAAVGFGLVESLFNGIGQGSASGVRNYSKPNSFRAGQETGPGGRMNIVQFKLEGKNLVGLLRTQDYYDSRVSTT